jgi:ribose-phosphate pyrophosphokinase
MSSSARGVLFFQTQEWESAWVDCGQVVAWQSGMYPNGEQWVRVEPADSKYEVIQIVARFTAREGLSVQMERLLLVVEATRRLTAHLKLILPYLPYSLQDRESAAGGAIGARMVARSLEAMGVDEVVLTDVHSPRDLEYWSVPVVEVSAAKLLAQRMMSTLDLSIPTALVAPDKGAALKAKQVGEMMGVPVTYLNKKRLGPGEVIIDVSGLVDLHVQQVVLVDDLLNTGGTLVEATKAILAQGMERGEAVEVSVAVTHGLFANGAMGKLAAAGVKHIFVTDSYEWEEGESADFVMNTISVESLFV